MEEKGSEGILNSLGAYRIGIFWKVHFIINPGEHLLEKIERNRICDFF
jgi:hypothetical protein